MKNIGSLLERLSKILNKDQAIKNSVIEAIKKMTGVTLSSESVELKEGILHISSFPAALNEIRLKEERIKDELREVYKISILKIFYK